MESHLVILERFLYHAGMASDTTLEREQRRAYLRDFVPAIAGYSLILAAALSVVGGEVTTLGEWALVMLPVVPALWAVRAVVRQLRRVDEYQRTVQLEAMAAAFGVAMVTSITLGFVGVAGTATAAGGWIVYSAGMLAWGFTLKLRTRS